VVERRLGVLAVFSMPQDGASLALRRERYELSRSFMEIASRKAVELRVLQYGATREQLRAALDEGTWDIIHFSGHGLAGGLVLETEDGRSDVVAAADLVGMLRSCRERTALVTLSSCSSAAAVASDALAVLGIEGPGHPFDEGVGLGISSLAVEIARDLGCAVLAMRYPVADEFAIAFTRSVYDLLVSKGRSLARAVQIALPRTARRPPVPGIPAISVATPALVGALAADLTLSPPRADLDVRRDDRSAGLPDEPGCFVGRAGILTRASDALHPWSEHSGVLFLGDAGAGKTLVALELTHRHRQRFQAIAWYQAPMPGDSIGGSLTDLARVLQTRVPALDFVDHMASRSQLDAHLSELSDYLRDRRLLVVIDGLEVLLDDGGSWRDDRWGMVVAALTCHRGLSRTILTSRLAPNDLDPGVRTELVGPLSTMEEILLAMELQGLGQVLHDAAGDVGGESSWLALRALAAAGGRPDRLLEIDELARDRRALAGLELSRLRLRSVTKDADTGMADLMAGAEAITAVLLTNGTWMGRPIHPVRAATASPRGTEGFYRVFEHAIVIWSERTAAHPVAYAVRQTYDRLLGTGGRLGFPLTTEMGAARSPHGTEGRFQRFEGTWDYPEDACLEPPGLRFGATVYWSETYGAHETWGGIGQFFERQGGTTGRLGFPVSGEREVTAGRGTIGASQLFEGGIVLWCQRADANSVWGAIRERYEEYGGIGGLLGFPVGPEQDATQSPRGTAGRYQRFEGPWDYGEHVRREAPPFGAVIHWTESAGACATWGRIGEMYDEMGASGGLLGFPLSDEVDAGRSQLGTDGRFQRFEGPWDGYPADLTARLGGPVGATIYWSEVHGAHPTWGAIGILYERMWGTTSRLGFPVSDEEDTVAASGETRGRLQRFEGGTCFWCPEHDAVGVYGQVLRVFEEHGGTGGRMGFPVSEEEPLPSASGDVIQFFEGGVITIRRGAGACWVRAILDADA
jgi:uncharacterized protein with LGFP repeats